MDNLKNDQWGKKGLHNLIKDRLNLVAIVY